MGKKIKRGYTAVLILYIVFVIFFMWLAHDQITYTSDNYVYIGKEIDHNTDEMLDGDWLEQSCYIHGSYVSGVTIYFQTYGRSDLEGAFIVKAFGENMEQPLAQAEIAAEDIVDASWNEVRFPERICAEELPNGRLTLQISNKGGVAGKTVTICYSSKKENPEDTFILRGQDIVNCAASIQTIECSLSAYRNIYLPVLLVGLFILVFYGARMIWAEKNGKKNLGVYFARVFDRYSFLMDQLVSRDFKTKYKRSVLGVLWSLLNPLLTMCVQYVVFSSIFRFQIPNYAVYLLTGIILYNGFSDTTTQAMSSITGNVSLITKVYVPKYIYPVSKVFSCCINILLSLIPLFLVSVFTGIRIQWSILLLPYVLICYIIFMIGMSFILSTAMVFFRDMQFLWGVLTMMWMYATPIMYPLDQLPIWMQRLEIVNPLYHYITFFRTILIDGVSPEPVAYLYCLVFALAFFLGGAWIFKKMQDKFVLYI